jgi:hemerythrin-like domain-containing protein
MDAFSLLKADHENVAALFEQLESASGRQKLEVFNQIRTELELHAHIEEKIFYPALEQPAETHDLTLEAYEEHDVVKKLLRELSRARTPNEEWEAKAKVLQENVEHHVEEEENELFPKANQVLGEEEIEELGELLQAEKARKQKGAAKGRTSASKSSARASGARKTASKKTGSKKAGAKKGGSKKSGAKKSSKKSGSKGSKKSGSKGSKKSGSKGSKKSGSKKSRR